MARNDNNDHENGPFTSTVASFREAPFTRVRSVRHAFWKEKRCTKHKVNTHFPLRPRQQLVHRSSKRVCLVTPTGYLFRVLMLKRLAIPGLSTVSMYTIFRAHMRFFALMPLLIVFLFRTSQAINHSI